MRCFHPFPRLMRRLLFVFALAFALPALAQPAIERVEPAFWWAGMVHTELQVLVYGDDLAGARVSLDAYPGVTLRETVAVESPSYVFLTLDLAPDVQPGTLTFRFDHPDGALTHAYELRPRTRQPGTYAQGFSSEDVIYLMMPDRFANGDVANDSIPGYLEGVDRSDVNARQGGDMRGVIDRLDYLDDLGLTAIWFTPVFENDMTPEYGAYHGYAATDMYAIDPRFGTNDEFIELVDACHARGMKVIMDMIHNHVGDRHWWMADPPTSDWFNSWEEYGQTNYVGAAALDPYASDSDRDRLLNGWFVREMPDLNQKNELLAQYLLQKTVWWIEHSGIDGIRMDTYVYPDKDYMARWVDYVMAEFPTFNIVGEAWLQRTAHQAYWQTGFEGHTDGYDARLRSVTDFQVHYALVRGFQDHSSLFELYIQLSQDYLYDHPNDLVTFLDNHDVPRYRTQVGGDAAAVRMALAVLLTTRGIPQVYYGTELAFENDGDEALGHGVRRQTMPGGWPDDDRSVFEAADRTPEEALTVEHFRALAQWRKTAEVVHDGRLTQFVPRNGTYVYFRWEDEPNGDAVMVVVNRNDEPYDLGLDRFSERLQGVTSGRDVVSGERYILDGEKVTLPARTTLVLELSR